MKDKIIETAGKTWRALGEQGEVELTQLPALLNEKEPIAYQAVGWLAREDKIRYTIQKNKTFIGLVETELRSFKNVIQSLQTKTPAQRNSRKN